MNKEHQKRKEQLGIHPSTASGKLVKDILFSLITETQKDNCYKCGEKLTRDTFSIEHKIPWLDSEKPKDLFFDLSNIGFSHLKCNVSSARKPNKKYANKKEYWAALRERHKEKKQILNKQRDRKRK